MKRFQLMAAVVAGCVSLPAFATTSPITTSYTFDNPTSYAKYNPYSEPNDTGPTSYAGLQGAGDTSTRATGSYFGNSLTFGATTNATSANGTVVISAYAGTGVGDGTNGYGGRTGVIENAVLTRFDPSGAGQGALGITSRNNGTSSISNDEFTCNGTTSCATVAAAGSYEHAIDNTGAFESLLLKFQSAVNLSSLTIGFPSAGTGNNNYSDATLLYYKGAGDPTSAMLGQTYAQLVSSGNWGYVNVMDISGSSCGSIAGCATVATTATAQYWMIGAYINTIGNNASLGDGVNDYIKLRSITTSRVPEPGSIALFGIAGAALYGTRRRRKVVG